MNKKLLTFAGVWNNNKEMDCLYREIEKGRHKKEERK